MSRPTLAGGQGLDDAAEHPLVGGSGVVLGDPGDALVEIVTDWCNDAAAAERGVGPLLVGTAGPPPPVCTVSYTDRVTVGVGGANSGFQSQAGAHPYSDGQSLFLD